MTVLTALGSFLVAVISDANFLVGIIVAVGLIVQKKSFSAVLGGAVRVAIGLLILSGGAAILTEVLAGLTPLIQQAFGTEGLLPSNESFLVLAMETFGADISLILVVSFLVNLLIARFTKWKYINLVTHHWLFAGAMLAVIFDAFAVENQWVIVLVSGCLAGFWATFIPAYLNRYMEKIVGSEPVAMGHFGGVAYLIGGVVGELFGDASHSMEEINIPKGFEFLKQDMVVTALITSLFFYAIVLIVPMEFMVQNGLIASGGFKILYAIENGLEFCAGITVLNQGVSMLLGEILPAFQGIAKVIVPNAKPALDCPVVMPYAPNAVTMGFIISTIFSIITTLVLQFLGGALVIPPVLQCFFIGGAAAVFANATGGRRGVILASAINGILFSALPLLLYQFTKASPGLEGLTIGDPDFVVLGSLMGFVLKGLQSIGLL